MYAYQSSTWSLSPDAKAPGSSGRSAGSSRAGDRQGPAGHRRFGFLTTDGALTWAGQGPEPVPPEKFEPQISRRAALAGEAILRPTVDNLGRTVILAYLPASGPAVALISLLYFGDSLRLAARQLGMRNLGARLCAALVETGSLRLAAASCGITPHTAQSEMAVAMEIAGVNSQSAVIRRVTEGWLRHPLGSERAIGLLMTTFGLSRRDASIASRRAAGETGPDVAKALGLSRWAIKSSSSRVFAMLGVAKAPELTRIVVDLLLTSDLAERVAADPSIGAGDGTA